MATHNDKSYCKTQVEIMTTRNARKSHHLRETHTVFTHDNNEPQSHHFFSIFFFFETTEFYLFICFIFVLLFASEIFFYRNFSPLFLFLLPQKKPFIFRPTTTKKKTWTSRRIQQKKTLKS